MMLSKKLFYCFVAFSLLIACPAVAQTWKLFFYMDASDNLADMAFKNITDLMRGKTNDNVDIVIQLHAYDKIALRYKVTGNGLLFAEETILSGDCKKDFINAASWAFAQNTADHTMLVFSNHGWGALDPRWNKETNEWNVTGMGLSNDGNDVCSLPKKGKLIYEEHHWRHRAFMFNAQCRTYLSNWALSEGLAYVQNLIQKKIDIVAFDTCMGSMLEVATCISPYANYLVGVQSCALRDGFDYQGFMKVLCQGGEPRQTASRFVDIFDTYYAEHDEAGIYTCAALDMNYVAVVNEALNNVVDQLLAHSEFIPLLKKACKDSPRFCLWPIYTDLIAFFKLVESQLLDLPSSDEIDALMKSIHTLYSAASTMVVARCGGQTIIENAYGFSIYLPPSVMDNSYSSSLFAQYSQWPSLMSLLCMANK